MKFINLSPSCTEDFTPDSGICVSFFWPPGLCLFQDVILYLICRCWFECTVWQWAGPNLILIFLSFSFLNPDSSSLPCLWCWQCYTIRQRFVHVFHQLHSCMFVCLCLCLCHTRGCPVDHTLLVSNLKNCPCLLAFTKFYFHIDS